MRKGVDGRRTVVEEVTKAAMVVIHGGNCVKLERISKAGSIHKTRKVVGFGKKKETVDETTKSDLTAFDPTYLERISTLQGSPILRSLLMHNLCGYGEFIPYCPLGVNATGGVFPIIDKLLASVLVSTVE